MVISLIYLFDRGINLCIPPPPLPLSTSMTAMPPSWPVRHFIIGGWGGGVQTREGMERDDVTASRKALYGLSLLASASTHGDAEGFKEQL